MPNGNNGTNIFGQRIYRQQAGYQLRRESRPYLRWPF